MIVYYLVKRWNYNTQQQKGIRIFSYKPNWEVLDI